MSREKWGINLGMKSVLTHDGRSWYYKFTHVISKYHDDPTVLGFSFRMYRILWDIDFENLTFGTYQRLHNLHIQQITSWSSALNCQDLESVDVSDPLRHSNPDPPHLSNIGFSRSNTQLAVQERLLWIFACINAQAITIYRKYVLCFLQAKSNKTPAHEMVFTSNEQSQCKTIHFLQSAAKSPVFIHMIKCEVAVSLHKALEYCRFDRLQSCGSAVKKFVGLDLVGKMLAYLQMAPILGLWEGSEPTTCSFCRSSSSGPSAGSSESLREKPVARKSILCILHHQSVLFHVINMRYRKVKVFCTSKEGASASTASSKYPSIGNWLSWPSSTITEIYSFLSL